FSAGDGRVEIGSGVGDGMHRGVKTGGADAAVCSLSGPTDSGGWFSGGGGQYSSRVWRNSGTTPGRTPRCRQSGLYRVDGSGPIDHENGGGHREKRDAGVRGKVSQYPVA